MPGTNPGFIIGRVSCRAAVPSDCVPMLYHVTSTLARHHGQGVNPIGRPQLPLYRDYSTRLGQIRGQMRGTAFLIEFNWDSGDIAALDPAGLPYRASLLVPRTRNAAGHPTSFRTIHLSGRRLQPAVNFAAIKRQFPALSKGHQTLVDVVNRVEQVMQVFGPSVPNTYTSRTPSPQMYALIDVLSTAVAAA